MTSTTNSHQPKKNSKATFSTVKARNRALGHPAEFGPVAFPWTGFDTRDTRQPAPDFRHHRGHHQRRGSCCGQRRAPAARARGSCASVQPRPHPTAGLTARGPWGPALPENHLAQTLSMERTLPNYQQPPPRNHGTHRLALAFCALKKGEIFVWFVFMLPFSTKRFSSPALMTELRPMSEI